jgi:hypothetical protein
MTLTIHLYLVPIVGVIMCTAVPLLLYTILHGAVFRHMDITRYKHSQYKSAQ